MKIYIDDSFKCHVSQTGDLIEIETDFFEGKCAEYIEGYRYIPESKTWTSDDGTKYTGVMVSPWRSWTELDAIQRAYEHEQYLNLFNKLSEVYEL